MEVSERRCASIVLRRSRLQDLASDQTSQGKGSNLMVGTAAQITDNLKRYNEAGLTMPLLWPPLQDLPASKTLDDLKQLKEEIIPKVEAMKPRRAMGGRTGSYRNAGERLTASSPKMLT